MARINIETRLQTDPRFCQLMILLGSKWAALGALVEGWTIAHQYLSSDNPRALVALGEFSKLSLCSKIIDVGLARIEGDFVYFMGAESLFQWRLRNREKASAGGQKSASQPRVSGRFTVRPKSKICKDLPSPARCETELTPSATEPPLSSFSSYNESRRLGEQCVRKDDGDGVIKIKDRFGDRFRYRSESREIMYILQQMYAPPPGPGEEAGATRLGVVPKIIANSVVQMIENCGGSVELAKATLEDKWQDPRIRVGEGVTSRTSYLTHAIIDAFNLEVRR